MRAGPPTVEQATEPRCNRGLIARCVLVCLVVKLGTWGLGYVLATKLPFDRADYFRNFAHYGVDARAVTDSGPRFFDLWNYSDSEWYLSLAAGGYPDLVSAPDCGPQGMRPPWSTERACRYKYAFFPLYPLMIAVAASVLSLPMAAFAVTTLLGLAAAAGVAVACAWCFPGRREAAVAGVELLFLFPFAIFYQLYFSECLFLLLSVLVFLCLWRRRYAAMLACGAMLAASRPLGVLVVIPLVVAILHTQSFASRAERMRAMVAALLVPLGLLPFVWVNKMRTGDWHYFSTVQRLWGYENGDVAANLWRNVVGKTVAFPHLALHSFHSSQLDYVTMIVFGLVLIAMWRRRDFPRELTVWSTVLWLAPLMSKDLMSFGRYMSVSFPVFLYLGLVCQGATRTGLVAAFAAGYVVALGGIVTYAWVG